MVYSHQQLVYKPVKPIDRWPWAILAILFRPFFSILSVPDECYSRNMSCTLDIYSHMYCHIVSRYTYIHMWTHYAMLHFYKVCCLYTDSHNKFLKRENRSYWWMLFQEHVVYTKFDIYVFIMTVFCFKNYLWYLH
jgi:hypothetical protein